MRLYQRKKMTEFWLDTPLIVSIWTLVTLWGFLWKLASSITKSKQDILNINERLEKIEALDLDSKLTKMDTDLQWIRATLTKIENRIG